MRRVVLLLTVMAATLLVAGGVALAVTKIGGPGSNVLYGTDNPDKIDGRGGDDVIFGLGGNDGHHSPGGDNYLIGGEGDDIIYGGEGDDDIYGGIRFFEQRGEKGKDILYGQEGDDIITGDSGADLIYGNEGFDSLSDGEERGGAVDTLYGGSESDYINSRNRPAGKDIVFCGDGRDYVDADRADVLHDCEGVRRR